MNEIRAIVRALQSVAVAHTKTAQEGDNDSIHYSSAQCGAVYVAIRVSSGCDYRVIRHDVPEEVPNNQ